MYYFWAILSPSYLASAWSAPAQAHLNSYFYVCKMSLVSNTNWATQCQSMIFKSLVELRVEITYSPNNPSLLVARTTFYLYFRINLNWFQMSENAFLIFSGLWNAYLHKKGPDIFGLVVYSSIWKLECFLQSENIIGSPTPSVTTGSARRWVEAQKHVWTILLLSYSGTLSPSPAPTA